MSQGPYSSLNLGYHVGDEISDVDENRRKLTEIFGSTIYMNQIHGDTVILVDAALSTTPRADALVTQEKNISLAVLVADCIPVLLWDQNTSCVAAAHVGRRGLVNGIALKVVDVMAKLGSQGITAEFGPSICGNCYEVGEDVFRQVTSTHPKAAFRAAKFDFALDLPGALTSALEELGVDVINSNICTVESKSHFSYRRDGITGRSAGVISL